MKTWTKRGLALLLCALMLVTLLPVAGAAEEEETPPDRVVVENLEQPLADQNVPEEIAPAPISADLQTPQETSQTEEEAQADLSSLLPLEERSISVDLSDRLPIELRSVKVSDLLAEEIKDADHPDRPLTGTEKVAWAESYGDDYQLVEMTDTIDLLAITDSYSTNFTLSMIVGSGKQLDGNNIRYTVRVTTFSIRQWLTPTLYSQNGEDVRTQVPIKNTYTYYYSDMGNIELSLLGKDHNKDDTLYVSLSPVPELASASSQYTFKVYDGDLEAYEAGSAEDITDKIWDQDMTQKNAGYFVQTNRYRDQAITIVLLDGDTVVGTMSYYLYVYVRYAGLSWSSIYLKENDSHTYPAYSGHDQYVTKGDVEYPEYVYTLYAGYPANGTYYQGLDYQNENGDLVTPSSPDFSKLLAVPEFYKTRAEAEAAIKAGKTKDIKDTLLSDSYDGGYSADYSKGITFSVFYEETAYHMAFKTVAGTAHAPGNNKDLPQRPGSSDTYFYVTGAQGYDTYDKIYTVSYQHDAYYYNGYQTAFLLDSEADLSTLKPTFYSQDVTHIYAGTPAVMQTSGENAHDFSKGPVAYSAASENGEKQKNYTVTFAKKQTGGASLFVNGANGPKEADGSTRRELFLNNYFGRGHDVFLANLGNEPMTDLQVTLSNAKNVKLDEYWTVGGEGNNTLDAFTRVRAPGYYDGELDNVAKIRLVPDGDGPISGKLSITYGVDQDAVVFTLTGQAGNPQITTTEIPVGVKYVPYGTMIQNSNIYDWNEVTYKLQSGKLPKGVELRPNGEIYGVPQETGKFTFQVRMDNSVTDFGRSYANFTLEVQNNTAENVAAQTDEGYEVSGLPSQMTSYTTQTFKSEGAMGEFIALWLDGKKLVEGEDYTKKEGSTVITADSKVFRDAGRGSHTIAFEFRVNGDVNQQLRKGAQNVNIGTTSGGGGSSGGGNSSGGGSSSHPSGGSSGGTTTKPTTPVTTTKEFIDVPKGGWFYDEVQWAVKNNAMIGVSDTAFAPNTLISQAMVTTVMARMSKVDLDRYSDVTGTNLLAGQWYTNASVWAWKGGIVGDSNFSALEPITRGDLAVMLVRYLDYRAVSHPKPKTPVEFADTKDMTAEENEAFQVLYAAGILKGVGDNCMAPDRSTTRVELATIAHRLSDYFAKR